ncbi:hypothetical protein HCN44_000444 [Aphidius gifuensis]|uniref:ubiquitinyl hydrolase 1 n=1 Tax=Aphidius gifuensis TaxID=684658 RepID=A0A834XSU8_APHGI|nr:hypothetical protein HCN44_000444 [Aphidius gifuensis]
MYNEGHRIEFIIKLITGILKAESAIKIAEREALAGTWDGEAKIITNNWKSKKCDLTQNLWLNLTDCSILCGRKFFNGTGGNDHAIEHYRTTGYPLAIELGTITKEGNDDVYSYDENEMVDDPNLIIHLSHWGFNISNMENTEKSIIELELDLNKKFGEWIALQIASSKLIPIFGACYTGLNNLGNSCYLNFNIFDDNYNDPANNFDTQISKLDCGLLSGKYSIEPNNKLNNEDYNRQGIPPRMFKNLISRGHPGFSSNRQQDAQEFFLHLINIIERHYVNKFNSIDCFKFKVEERYQCSSSGKVKYSYRPEYLLPLLIPRDCAINKDEVNTDDKKTAELNGQSFDTNNTIIRLHIKLSSCLESCLYL